MDLTAFLYQQWAGEPAWIWISFLTFVFAALYLDLKVFNKKDHVIDLKESLRLSAVYVALGILFGGWVWLRNGQADAMDYYTVYLLEESLSLDNLFVMSVIFASFHIPREFQHRVLIWGILGVILLRGVMIGVGATLIEEYSWVLFIFAAILIYTGIKMLFIETDDDEDYTQKGYVRFLAAHMRVDDKLHGNHFFVKIADAKDKLVWFATPLFLTLCVIELTDVMFAFDSVPAALAITTDPYIVYTANIFAILGLRALFFAMEHVLHRFSYLKYSLSIVLVFIGLKVFYNHFVAKDITGTMSLLITLGVLGLGVVISMIKTRGQEETH